MDDGTLRPAAAGANEAAEGEKMQRLLDEWKRVVDKLDELQQWLVRAEQEVKGAKPNDPRWKVYQDVEAAAARLDKELQEIEKQQEAALTGYLEAAGPQTLVMDDGVSRVLSAQARTASGPADLLPRDLLAVWRVAAVFGGSVVLDGKPAKLTFGDAQQIALTKPKKERKR